jgi:hypothetical protein
MIEERKELCLEIAFQHYLLAHMQICRVFAIVFNTADRNMVISVLYMQNILIINYNYVCVEWLIMYIV